MTLTRFIAATLATAVCVVAQAQPTHVTLTDADERLRCGAGTAYYPVATLKAGTVLEVRDQTENGWFAVTYPKTLDALVPARKTRVEDGIVVLTEPDRLLALHATLGPSASWAKLLEKPLPEGTRLFSSEATPGARESERWLRVRAPGDALAYLRVNAVRPSTQTEIAAFRNPEPAKTEESEQGEQESVEQATTEQESVEQAPAETEQESTPMIAGDPEPSQEPAQAEPTETNPVDAQESTAESVEVPPAAETQQEPSNGAQNDSPINPFQATPAEPTPDDRPNPFSGSERPVEQTATEETSTEPDTSGPTNPFAPAASGEQPTSEQQPAQAEPAQSNSTQEAAQPATQPATQPETQAEPEPLDPVTLDELYRNVRRQPTIEAEFVQLIEQYDRTLADGEVDEQTADVLKRQRAVLEIRQGVQREMIANAESQREARRRRAAAEIETQRLTANRPFDVEGRLRRSVVYSGTALPLLYRVVSVVPGEEGLTLAYVQDSESLKLDRFDGRVVGFYGSFERIAGGAVQSFRANSVRPLAEPVRAE